MHFICTGSNNVNMAEEEEEAEAGEFICPPGNNNLH